MSRYRPMIQPTLYHFSKDKRIRGRVINGTSTNMAYIFDNRTNKIILSKEFTLKEVREANEWMYEHLDCTLFTLLQAMPKKA